MVAVYDRVEAVVKGCEKGWGNIVATGSNKTSQSFGCAVNKNLAAMLIDPRDAERPRAVTPADAGRRAVVLDKYRQGLVTSTARDDQATGSVSKSQ